MSEWVGLFEGDGTFAVELEQREEPGDDEQSEIAVGDEFVESDPDAGAAGAQQAEDVGGLFGNRHLRGVQVVEADGGGWFRPEGGGRDLGEAVRVDTEHDLRYEILVALLERHRARIAAQGGGLEGGELFGDLLVGPVLQ